MPADRLRRVGLFGTRLTMESGIYRTALETCGVELVLPAEHQRAWIDDAYMNELLINVFRDDTRETLVAIAERLRDDEGIDGLILGGTELPLLLRGVAIDGVVVLDTTAIHVDRIVEALL